jgi:hypothetical protein
MTLHLLDDLNEALVARPLGEKHRLRLVGSSGRFSIVCAMRAFRAPF